MLFLVFLALSVGQSFAVRCCAPNLWEGKVGMVVGTYASETNQHYFEGGAAIFVDSPNGLMAQFQSITYDGYPVQQHLIMDSKRGIVNIVNTTDGSCSRALLGDFNADNCIPDNATYTDFYFGMGNQKMKAKSSMIDYGTYQIYLSVDEATCLPITEDVTGTIDGTQVIKRYVFVNVTTGVSDRSVFTVPATCNSAVIGPKIPMLGRRRSVYGL